MIPHRSITKVLLVGEYSEGGMTWNCLETLRTLGYQVAPFVTTTRTSSILPQRMSSLISRITDTFINKKLIAQVKNYNPDLIFLFKAHNITPRTLAYLKKTTSARIINWYPDNPFTVWNGNSHTNILASLPIYDAFVIWSQMLINPLKSAGCKKAIYAPFGYHAPLLEQVIPYTDEDVARFTCDVSFIGTWDINRQQWLEQLVQHMPQLNFALWGNDWDSKLPETSPLRAYLRGPAQYNQNMVKIVRLSRISLNFIREQNITSHNMRTIEIPACGGFQLTQRTYEQAEFLFAEGKTIACFSTIDELVTKITYYLNNPDERQKIATTSTHQAQQYRLSDVMQNILERLEQPAGQFYASETDQNMQSSL
jgi:spore maturation protein CgeB